MLPGMIANGGSVCEDAERGIRRLTHPPALNVAPTSRRVGAGRDGLDGKQMKTRTVQLGEVCEFIRGVTFDKADASDRPAFGNTPILRAGNIGDDLDTRNDLVWVPSNRVSDEQLLRRNDIAICMSSGSSEVVGKTARVSSDTRASIGSFCGIIRPKNPEQAGYISFFFRSSAFRRHRDAIARGANIQNLRFSQFEEIEFDIPEDQRRIAGMLEQADRLRRTRRYALDLTDTFLPAAFLEMFGDPVKNPSGWNRSTVENVVVGGEKGVTTGPFGTQLGREDFVPVGPEVYGIYSIGEHGEFVTGSKKCITKAKFYSLKRFSVEAGDILISRMGTVGRVCVVSRDRPEGIVSYHLIRIRPDTGMCHPTFLAHLLGSERYLSSVLIRLARGAIMSGINAEIVLSLPIPVPPLPLQQRFADLVRGHERLRAAQRESLRQAEHLFQSLLHRAFAEEK